MDDTKQIIIGSDPDLPIWKVSFTFFRKNGLCIDFHSKRNHKEKKILYARRTLRKLIFYKTKEMTEPINVWHRITQDPRILFEKIKNE
tara:strand:+ start:755 stop:1018 length:264 start_codon:yes stop_codon:yes gene_type:complete